MASWIEASPTQRWHQYQKPADRATVAAAAQMGAEWSAMLGKMWQHRRATAPGTFERRQANRRIRTELMHWRNHRRAVTEARARLNRFG